MLRRLWLELVHDLSGFGRGLGRSKFLTRYVRKARRYSIGEFPDGKFGRVVGQATARGGQTLVAPVSGLPCVFYILRVADPLMRDRKTGDPVVLARDVSDAAFFLEDSSGRALIDPAGAMGFLGEPVAAGTCARAPSAVMWLLQAHGQTAHARFAYAEWIVPPGAFVSVLGGGVREPDPDAPPSPQYRGEPAMRLRIARTEPYALMISDAGETFR